MPFRKKELRLVMYSLHSAVFKAHFFLKMYKNRVICFCKLTLTPTLHMYIYIILLLLWHSEHKLLILHLVYLYENLIAIIYFE